MKNQRYELVRVCAASVPEAEYERSIGQPWGEFARGNLQSAPQPTAKALSDR
jgi:hypothetical protein